MADEIYEYYTVIPSKSTSLYKEKGSKFIGYIFTVNNEEEVNQSLEAVKKEHPQARHICYTYTYGIQNKTFRANDDGEPSNSAGMPIYNQIQSFDLDNVLIAVVRYFGGTKLGVPGLINAYKTAAQLSIEQSKIIKIEIQFLAKIECNYDQLSSVYHYLNTHTSKIVDQQLEQNCILTIEFPLKDKDEVLNYFNEQPYSFELIKD